MRIFLLSIVLSTPAFSLALADDAPNCAPGWVTNSCGDYTGCTQPEWVCCPLPSGNGWQWSDPPCPTDE